MARNSNAARMAHESGKMYLHTIPLLLLSEFQSERFYWNTLKDLITAEVFLNDKRVDLDLVAIRPYKNQLFVALSENNANTGIFLPINSTGRHFLRTEWSLSLSGSQLEDQRFSHIQSIDIDSAEAIEDQTEVFSIADAWAPLDHEEYTSDDSNLTTYVGTNMTLHKKRVNAFNSVISKNGPIQTIVEHITVSGSSYFFSPRHQ